MAYGKNAPFGLELRQNLTATTPNGQLSEYLINPDYDTRIFTCDPVVMLNDGTIGIWSAGKAFAGTFWGCKYISNVPNSQGNVTFSPYWPGKTAIAPNTYVTALIADDPTLLYDVQVSNSNPGGGNAAARQLGARLQDLNQNADLALGGTTFADAGALKIPQNPTSGSTISGKSGYYLDASTIGANANRLLKIIRLTPNPLNAFYTAPDYQGIGNGAAGAFNNVIVAINNAAFKGGTGTYGGNAIVQSGILTSANIKADGGGMRSNPHQIIAAPGAGLAIVVNKFVLSVSNLNNNTAYTIAGAPVIGLQYGNDPALPADDRITETQPATIFTTQGALGPFTFNGIPVTPRENAAVYISNDTANNFATGTPDYQYTITYSVIPVLP